MLAAALTVGLIGLGAVMPPSAVAADGGMAAGVIGPLAISRGGRYVAFASGSSDLVRGDTNHARDVFLRDRRAGSTFRVSVGSDGRQGNGDSGSPTVSADGRYVAFTSSASNLVPHDTNGVADIFLRDVQAGTTRLISADPHGRAGNGASGSPAITGSGYEVVFSSAASNLAPTDHNGHTDVFARYWLEDRTTMVSSVGDANGDSGQPAISADGSVIAFTSAASNLAPPDTNHSTDIFLAWLGVHGDGVAIAPVSHRYNTPQPNGDSAHPSISAHGSVVVFSSVASNIVPGDTNGASDVFRSNLQTIAPTTLISLNAHGGPANGASGSPSVSDDGLRVAFTSAASNLVRDDANDAEDIFVRHLNRRDPTTSTTTLASQGHCGDPANGPSNAPALSGNGQVVAFRSTASNLVPGDSNSAPDAFARNLAANHTTLLSDTLSGAYRPDHLRSTPIARAGAAESIRPG